MDPETRLLIVDDDPGIRELTAGFLAGHGYLVDVAEDAAAMRSALARHAYALVVLDVMMPGEDGLSVLRSLDRANAPPVIILSVIGEEVDRIVGLEMGADDYIAKPANPRELLARIRSVLRRQQGRPATIATVSTLPTARPYLRFAGWRLDPLARQLFNPDDVVINLSDGEFRLLIALVGRPPGTDPRLPARPVAGRQCRAFRPRDRRPDQPPAPQAAPRRRARRRRSRPHRAQRRLYVHGRCRAWLSGAPDPAGHRSRDRSSCSSSYRCWWRRRSRSSSLSPARRRSTSRTAFARSGRR
ncbi:response regulator [Sphingomonas sp. MMS24-JH45]